MVFLLGCAESSGVGQYDVPDGGDTDTEWMLDDFDCERACDVEAGCMVNATEQTWSECVDGCEASIAVSTTHELQDAAECVWTECVLGSEAGDVQCLEWVTCCNDCTE